jgi:hypothetical protein
MPLSRSSSADSSAPNDAQVHEMADAIAATVTNQIGCALNRLNLEEVYGLPSHRGLDANHF